MEKSTALTEEVSGFLGRNRYERVPSQNNGYRNGHRKRRVQIGSGLLDVNAPKVTGAYSDVATYLYDGNNRRVKKDLETGTDVLYLYDGWQVVEERELDGANWEARRQYVYGGRYIDEALLFDKDTDDDGDCTEGEGAGSKRYLYCHNNNFNVLALADANGAVAERYKYDPYGKCTVALDDSSENPYRFQGRRLDPETGLYYFRNRMYHPLLGRWMQRDPIGYADGMGLHEYVKGNPFLFNDPTGLRSRVTRVLPGHEEWESWCKLDCKDMWGRCVAGAGKEFLACCARFGVNIAASSLGHAVAQFVFASVMESYGAVYAGPIAWAAIGVKTVGDVYASSTLSHLL